MKTTRSEELFQRARELMPGGVNSPVRAFRSVGGTPRFIARGEGAYVWDEDGNRYVDYLGSWGPLILGHAAPAVTRALHDAIARGTSFGAPTAAEVRLAELVVEFVPSIEVVRFVSSGTEAAMSALRLARACSRRDKIVKLAGGYHGHADALLVSAGSGVLTLGFPDSPGVPAGTAAGTLTADYNNLESVERLFDANPGEIAAVIVEPVAGNMGVVPPLPGFLAGLRTLCTGNGAMLIFDEVITGFRLARGGAQEVYGVTPDLTVLGKILGGGLPVGAYGGRAEHMRLIAPDGPVYQAGTLSGNPLAMTAGIATLEALRAPGVYERLQTLSSLLVAGLEEAARDAGVTVAQNRVDSMWTSFFCAGPVVDYATARTADAARHARFFHAMLERGVYFAPSQFEAGFISLAHTEADVDATVAAAREAFATLP